jgi:signal recognition particle receptor subunit beta
MVQINFALKEVNCKIVYYGPGLSGKTTNLEVVHAKAPGSHCGELTSIATEGDRTLFFDFLPLNLGQVAGMTTKFQIYTVPGQVYYNSTRKLVLQGADGIAFVAESRKGKMDENIESLSNLEDNLREYGMDINTIPLVLQYNKRDLADIYSIEEMNAKLNSSNVPYFEAVAVTGEGVFPTLKKLSSLVLESLNRQQSSTIVKAPKKKRKKVAAVKPPAPVGAARPVPVMSGGGAEEATRARAGAPAPRQGTPRPRAGAASPRPRPRVNEQQGRVARAPVVDSPDVKSVEKRVLNPRSSGGHPRPGVRLPRANQTPKKKSFATVWVLIVGLLGATAAVVYFSGALDSFLK